MRDKMSYLNNSPVLWPESGTVKKKTSSPKSLQKMSDVHRDFELHFNFSSYLPKEWMNWVRSPANPTVTAVTLLTGTGLDPQNWESPLSRIELMGFWRPERQDSLLKIE